MCEGEAGEVRAEIEDSGGLARVGGRVVGRVGNRIGEVNGLGYGEYRGGQGRLKELRTANGGVPFLPGHQPQCYYLAKGDAQDKLQDGDGYRQGSA